MHIYSREQIMQKLEIDKSLLSFYSISSTFDYLTFFPKSL